MPLDLELLPDKPQTQIAQKSNFSFLNSDLLPDKPKPSLFKETLKETSAQLQDLLTMPSRLTGFPHPPMVSKLAIETIPSLLQKATTPFATIKIPPLSLKNIKSVFSGKGITEEAEIEPSVFDVAWYSALIGYPTFQNIVSRQQWNTTINKLIQTERFKGTVMKNMPAIEQYMSGAGIKLKPDLPLESKVDVVISQAQRSPILTDVLIGLERGKIKAKPPITAPIIETEAIKPITTPTPITPTTILAPTIPKTKPPIIAKPIIPIPTPVIPKPTLSLAIRLTSGEVIVDETAKLHSDIIASKGINPDDVQDVGIEVKGKYQATKLPDEKGGVPLETLPEVPKEILEKAKGILDITKLPDKPVTPAKVIPAKKTLQVLPHKEQLLTQIEEAIKKAPTYDEVYTIAQQKAGLEATESDIYTQFPKVSFQVDGGANIINAKESLQKFYDAVKKTPATMGVKKIYEKGISPPQGIKTFEKQYQQAVEKGTKKEIAIAKQNLEEAKKLFKQLTISTPSYPSGTAGLAEYMEEFVPKEHTSKVEMPELVKLAKELLGNVPIVVRLKRNLGLFVGKLPPKIKLRPDIFKNPFLAGQVLAHEIGHLVDWLPTHILSRGGLLNRLLTVSNFIKEEFGSLKELAIARKERIEEVGATNAEIKEELQKATLYWHPFEPIPSSYTNLRFSSKELYADALSMLLIQPEKLEELAPKFYSAFWRFIDRKPEVKQALLELQDFLALGEGEKLRIRSQDIRSMFKKGEELFYEKRTQYQAQQKSLYFRLKTEHIDKNTAILNKLKEAEKQGKKINPEDNPKYYLEDWNYIGGKVKNLLDKINMDVIIPLTTQGITQDDLGEYLFLQRVVTERKDIANPLGQNRETAQKQLDYLLERLGQDKFDILKTSVDKFQGILKNLLDEAQKVGFYKEETFAEIITNPAYATFQVLDYLDDYVTPAVIHQIGTLKGIANPFISTTLKMISTLRAVERVKTNNSIINFMKDNFPVEIQSAKIRRFGKYKAEAVEKEGFGIIKTREEGKLKGYYVDPYIADSINYQPIARNNAILSIFKFLNRSYFRPVYVNLNLGFQTFNLMRDFVRAWKLNPDVTFPQMLKKYAEAIPIAKRRIWGNFTDPVITEMQQSGMLSFTYNNLMRGVEDEETQIEFLMKQYDILKKNPQNPVMKVLNAIEELGDFIETLPKVTGYLSRVKSGRNIKEIAHEVRVFSGSPDFLRKGAGYDWYNNVFLFSNAFKEGFRGDYEGAFRNPRTRSGYWWRTAKLNLLPKILMFLATLGLFGQRIKENFDKQTEFDKTNYTTIPLGTTEEDKAIYLRIPNDEVGRLLSGILWKGLNFKKTNILQSIQQITSLTAGQLPSLSPEVEIASAITQYAVGQNPYDFFRGRTILTDDEMKAGGWYSLKPMLGWFAGKMGVYGLTIRAKKEDESPFEKIIKWTPIIQRYIRITAYGEEEKERQERQEREQRKAIRRIHKRELRYGR